MDKSERETFEASHPEFEEHRAAELRRKSVGSGDMYVENVEKV